MSDDWSGDWSDDWSKDEPPLVPLKVKCTDADCEKNLHCFLETKQLINKGKVGACRYCEAELVDWERVRKKDLTDWAYTFEALKHEKIRHHLWHVPIDEKAVKHARRKGRKKMREAVDNRLRRAIAPLPSAWDGRQTPFEGNSIFYAQHATATCCRNCLKEWYAIPKDRELTNSEISYFIELIMLYVNDRLPFLTEEGERIPFRNSR
jgi:hypothetical protein